MPQVSAEVRNELLSRAANFDIVLEDVAITHLSFGTEFSKAIEAKQVAYQDAERAKYVVLKAEQERKVALTLKTPPAPNSPLALPCLPFRRLGTLNAPAS